MNVDRSLARVASSAAAHTALWLNLVVSRSPIVRVLQLSPRVRQRFRAPSGVFPLGFGRQADAPPVVPAGGPRAVRLCIPE